MVIVRQTRPYFKTDVSVDAQIRACFTTAQALEEYKMTKTIVINNFTGYKIESWDSFVLHRKNKHVFLEFWA